jgi:hypothetical protein
VLIDDLKCAAEALRFMEYLSGETVEAVALYGTGVLVSVPPPIKYAIHKLLIAQERKEGSPKRRKDLQQAKDLIEVFLEMDSAAFEEALGDAKARGPSWKKNINASLRNINEGARQGSFPLSPKKSVRRA